MVRKPTAKWMHRHAQMPHSHHRWLLILTFASRVRAAFFVPRPAAPTSCRSLRRFRSSSTKFAIEANGDGDGDVTNPPPPRAAVSQSAEIPAVGTPTSSALFEDALFLERFKRRRDESSSKIEAERQLRTPSNSTHFADDPKNVISSILDGLLRPHDPVPYFGYEILYATSTTAWKDVLRKSVGAPPGTEEGLIFRALSASMERPDNQFGIMVGSGTDRRGASANNDADENEKQPRDNGYYAIEFPWDTLDYLDGTSWVECRMRDGESDELLVVLGWSMKQRDEDGAWLIDGIDWQDFREKYRPGIGREEWERICG